jgi:hypothetical protein
MSSNINNPRHYIFTFPCNEVRDVIADRVAYAITVWTPACLYDYINAIKYVLRAPEKNKLEDLKKARACLDNLINTIEKL